MTLYTLQAARKKKADAEKRSRRGVDEEDMEEQTSGNKALIGEVCGQGIAVNLAHNTHGRDFGEGASEVISRQAINLGMMIAHSAEGAEAAATRKHWESVKNNRDLDVKELPPAGNGCTVHTNRPLFMAQDMYVAAYGVWQGVSSWKIWLTVGTLWSHPRMKPISRITPISINTLIIIQH